MKQTCVQPGGKPTQAKFDQEAKLLLESIEREYECEDTISKATGGQGTLFVRGGTQGSFKAQPDESEKGQLYIPQAMLQQQQSNQQQQKPSSRQEEELNPYLLYENQKMRKDEKTKTQVDEFFNLLKSKNSNQATSSTSSSSRSGSSRTGTSTSSSSTGERTKSGWSNSSSSSSSSNTQLQNSQTTDISGIDGFID